ncbi:hypothetical protein KQH51_05380 [bacterium]|nr:hypothetical protein [bacterium]MCB2202347.1 hypothetical protein [bacterium]
MRRLILLGISLAVVSLTLTCGEDETPSRDYYPILKENVYRLQEAVADRDPAAIDSMLTVESLDLNMSSDSLLSFVYGSSGDLPFEAFGDCKIMYTDRKARIDCWIMDSTRSEDRSITFTYVLVQDSTWLLKRFEVTPDVSITDIDTAIGDSSLE